jgi:hypothetical protein
MITFTIAVDENSGRTVPSCRLRFLVCASEASLDRGSS